MALTADDTRLKRDAALKVLPAALLAVSGRIPQVVKKSVGVTSNVEERLEWYNAGATGYPLHPATNIDVGGL